jgi:predicted metal-binding transcription factor (methanogenesis marker protein 9)
MGIGTCLPILFCPKHQKYHSIFTKKGKKDFILTKKIFATNKTIALGDHHKWP